MMESTGGSLGIEYEDSVTVPSNDGIGIDLGLKIWRYVLMAIKM